MPIVYSLVARGKTVLAEYTAASGNFPTVTRVLLSKIPEHDGKMSYLYDTHLFHYIVENGIVYLCMTDEDTKRRVPFAFLEDIKSRFVLSCGEQAQTAIAFSLNETFGPVLKKQMEYYNSNPQADQFSAVQSKIDDARNVMLDNIDKLLSRGEKIELLVDKTESLNQSAFTFERSSRQLKSSMIWKRVKFYLVIALVLALVIFFITAVACGGMDFKEC